MAILFEDGEIVSQPPEGKTLLRTDASGALITVTADGETPVSGGGVETIEGDGIDNTDPANPVFDLVDAITDATPTAVTAALDAATATANGLLTASEKGFLAKFGTDLTDADVSVAPSTLKISALRLPESVTLTLDRALTLEDTNAVNLDLVTVIVQNLSAVRSYTIKNAVGTNLVVHGPNAGQAKAYQFYFNGTHWALSTQWWVA